MALFGNRKMFDEDEDDRPFTFSNQLLEQTKKDNAKLKRLISAYKTAKPERASKILVSIHKIIDQHM